MWRTQAHDPIALQGLQNKHLRCASGGPCAAFDGGLAPVACVTDFGISLSGCWRLNGDVAAFSGAH